MSFLGNPASLKNVIRRYLTAVTHPPCARRSANTATRGTDPQAATNSHRVVDHRSVAVGVQVELRPSQPSPRAGGRCVPGSTKRASHRPRGEALHKQSRDRAESDGADVLGLGTLLALFHRELDTLTLIEGSVTRAGHGRVMHEDVRAASVLSDEAEAFFTVEPLHTALSHAVNNFFSVVSRANSW